MRDPHSVTRAVAELVDEMLRERATAADTLADVQQRLVATTAEAAELRAARDEAQLAAAKLKAERPALMALIETAQASRDKAMTQLERAIEELERVQKVLKQKEYSEKPLRDEIEQLKNRCAVLADETDILRKALKDERSKRLVEQA